MRDFASSTCRVALTVALATIASTAVAASDPAARLQDTARRTDDAPVRFVRTSNQTPWIYINHYITNYALDITVGAYDPDGSVVYLVVDFGDGTTASVAGSEITTQHVYVTSGTYTITVTALDNGGGYSVGTRSVWISGSDST
ncbi:MAG: PKD domain-containing protein [Xanthomonadaceae bacterium]|nr:PKD domain-containing protein [Xanthomonadaceae bacterium]